MENRFGPSQFFAFQTFGGEYWLSRKSRLRAHNHHHSQPQGPLPSNFGKKSKVTDIESQIQKIVLPVWILVAEDVQISFSYPPGSFSFPSGAPSLRVTQLHPLFSLPSTNDIICIESGILLRRVKLSRNLLLVNHKYNGSQLQWDTGHVQASGWEEDLASSGRQTQEEGLLISSN